METFVKPQNLNGTQLLEELATAGIAVEGLPIDDGAGNLILNVSSKDKEAAKKIVGLHNGIIIAAEPTVEEKLANVGLNLDDLKAALGL